MRKRQKSDHAAAKPSRRARCLACSVRIIGEHGAESGESDKDERKKSNLGRAHGNPFDENAVEA